MAFKKIEYQPGDKLQSNHFNSLQDAVLENTANSTGMPEKVKELNQKISQLQAKDNTLKADVDKLAKEVSSISDRDVTITKLRQNTIDDEQHLYTVAGLILDEMLTNEQVSYWLNYYNYPTLLTISKGNDYLNKKCAIMTVVMQNSFVVYTGEQDGSKWTFTKDVFLPNNS